MTRNPEKESRCSLACAEEPHIFNSRACTIADNVSTFLGQSKSESCRGCALDTEAVWKSCEQRDSLPLFSKMKWLDNT